MNEYPTPLSYEQRIKLERAEYLVTLACTVVEKTWNFVASQFGRRASQHAHA